MMRKMPLVLCPGLLCDAALWAPQIEALREIAEVFIPDLAREETMAGMGAAVLREAPWPQFALAGLSMGGYGTWIYGAMKIDTFAALMPICGGGKVEDAAALAKVPIWAFHGAADETVKPEESRKMVEAVKKAGGNVQYTEYKGVGHNSWDAAYGDSKAITWLLSQRKK